MRKTVYQEDLTDSKLLGNYWLSDGSKLDPLLVKSIIDKYISLKFEHLLKGDIIREDYLGEVRLIVRRYTMGGSQESLESKLDIIISSTGWRIGPEMKDMINERLKDTPDLFEIYKG